MTATNAIKVLKNSPAWDYLSGSGIPEDTMTEFCDAIDVAIMCVTACERIQKILNASNTPGAETPEGDLDAPQNIEADAAANGRFINAASEHHGEFE